MSSAGEISPAGGGARWASPVVLLCVLAVLVSRVACSGPDAATTPDGAMNPSDAPGPTDPCADGAECDRQTLGEFQVSTGRTQGGFRSVVDGPVGPAEISWSILGEQTTFRYKLAGGAFGPEVMIDAAPAEMTGVSRAAAFLYGSDVALREGSAGKDGGAEDLAATAKYTGPNGVANTAGCDQIHVFDCTNVGGCCDAHDECINANCGGQGDCGNVLAALQAGFTDQPCSPACVSCHAVVVRCFLVDLIVPGPSHCCQEGDCGRAQECMIDGVVITDPCKCQDAGIGSQSEANCERPCPVPNDPCKPDGEFVSYKCECCSTAVRIHAPGVLECGRLR